MENRVNNKLDFSLLILVHNEAGIIEKVIRKFHRKILSRLPRSELIVVEDGSTDGTKEILVKLNDEYPFALFMETGKQGYTAALRKAMETCRGRGEYIFFSDSDGQHEQDDFWKLKENIGNADMVIGVKAHRRDSLFRNLISRWMNQNVVPLLFGVHLHDINCGFRLMRKKVVEYLLEEKWFFQDCIFTELTLRTLQEGFRVSEVPVKHYQRLFGTSSGLPAKKMPVVLTRILINFLKLRREFARHSQTPPTPPREKTR